MLLDLPGVIAFLGDILITSKDNVEHFERLKQICNRLKDNGLTVSQDKYKFFKTLEYLGFVIDKTVLQPFKAKVKAILETPGPKIKNQVKRYLGMIN